MTRNNTTTATCRYFGLVGIDRTMHVWPLPCSLSLYTSDTLADRKMLNGVDFPGSEEREILLFIWELGCSKLASLFIHDQRNISVHDSDDDRLREDRAARTQIGRGLSTSFTSALRGSFWCIKP